MNTTFRSLFATTLLAGAAALSFSPAIAQNEVILGPVGPSPYDIIPAWHKPFQEPGFAFGGNSGVFAESPDRILIAMRGEARLPQPVPPEYAGYAGSIGINVLQATELRTWRNCLYALDGDGNLIENWTQWDVLCADSDGPGPHRLRISPYDPEKRVWVINETFHTIYVFSNDGSELLMTLGEKGVPGWDETHFGRPRSGQSPRGDPGQGREIHRRVRRLRHRARSVQRRALGRGRPEQHDLCPGPLRRSHQHLPPDR
jgi:hypothetical protein